MKMRLIAASVLIIATALALFLIFPRKSEPTYRDRSLRHWLANLLINPADAEATEALRAIGTNAYPFLVERVRAQDSRIVRLARGELGLELARLPASYQNRQAAIGFKIVGPQFQSWLPALTSGLTNWSGITPIILGEIGEPALPAVIACLTNEDHLLRCGAATTFMFFTCDTKPAEAALLKVLGDSDQRVRHRAAMALARIKPNETVLRAFVQNLHSTNRALVMASMVGLKHMGLSATSAVPALAELSLNEDEEIRASAAKLIRQIK